MSIRALACLLLLAVASAQAATPAKRKAESAAPPQEIDVDAMARAKDAGAQPPPAEGTAAEAPPAQAEPAPTEPAATPAAGEAAAAEPAATQDAAPESAAAQSPAPAAPKTAAEQGKSQDALALTPPIDAQEKRLAASCESRSKNLLDSAQKGDFAAASKDFDAKMRGAMPAPKFKETWGQLAQFGALQARGQSHPAKGEGYFIVMTPLIFEKATLVAQIACGSDGRIAGFHVKPLAAALKQ
jgi:hypothetical protein